MDAGSPLEAFDDKVVIAYSGKADKEERFVREMDRVSCPDFRVCWLVDNPYDSVIFKGAKMAMREKYLSVTMGHYTSVKSAYQRGCASVLVMEDDARFLRDTDALRRGIGLLPDDYDLAMLDSFPERVFNEDDHRKILEARVNDTWCRCSVKRCSSACYAMSRRGMERYIEVLEDAAYDRGALRCSDQVFTNEIWSDLTWYVSFPNLAIQCESANTTTSYDSIREIYKKEGIRYDDYASY